MRMMGRQRGKRLAVIIADGACAHAGKASAVDGARDNFERELARAFVEGVRWAARNLDERELGWCAADESELVK